MAANKVAQSTLEDAVERRRAAWRAFCLAANRYDRDQTSANWDAAYWAKEKYDDALQAWRELQPKTKRGRKLLYWTGVTPVYG